MSKWMSRRHKLSRAPSRSGPMRGNPKCERCGLGQSVRQGSLGICFCMYCFLSSKRLQKLDLADTIALTLNKRKTRNRRVNILPKITHRIETQCQVYVVQTVYCSVILLPYITAEKSEEIQPLCQSRWPVGNACRHKMNHHFTFSWQSVHVLLVFERETFPVRGSVWCYSTLWRPVRNTFLTT